MKTGTTLTRFIIEEQRKYPNATGEFTALLSEIATAAKMISREVNKAGLAQILGLTGKTNVHGETVQKLDEFANTTIIQALDHTGHLAGMASEEMEDIYQIPDKHPRGKYILVFDPLDGSSNIDVNVSIGTIFSIYRKKSGGDGIVLGDFLRRGREQLCAGYIIYGSSTMLIYTTGQGVHGFTLDPSLGEFLLSHENIRIPARGKIYSVNEGNYELWEEGVKKYINLLKSPEYSYGSRYIGSLVCDFHRNLLKGGIFLYPGDKKNRCGKLRLLYEASPLAFLVEQAGGLATDGERSILDIEPEKLHQKTPLYIGSEEDVWEAMEYIHKYQAFSRQPSTL